MPKPNPSKTMPWPENLIYDFQLNTSTTAEEAQVFINSLSTTDRNKDFLRLRYVEGKSYSEIGAQYGMTGTGVRLALKNIAEKHGNVAVPAVAPAATAPAAEGHTVSPAAVAPATASTTAPVEENSVLIVDPAALNGIALIEAIRVLYRRVGAANFEAALTELRDCLVALQPGKEQ